MAEQTIKLGGKDFQANLSIEALERIEANFNNESLGATIARTAGSVRVARAILVACITEAMPNAKMEAINGAITKEITDNGADAIWESIKDLVNASGFYGKKKAKDSALGN